MAKFTANHAHLYFDNLCRTKKGESVLSLIHATYQVKKDKNIDIQKDVKIEICRRLKDAYNLFKGDAGTYTGDPKQFSSQYTIGHELCIWKNSNLDLTELAIEVAENRITIRDYFDIVFLNYIQPINGNIVHVLYHLLVYMQKNDLKIIDKEQMGAVYMSVGHSSEKGNINGAYNMLIATNYFKPDVSGRELIYIGKCSIEELIQRCDVTYVKAGYKKALEDLSDEANYIKYLLHDYRYKDECIQKETKKQRISGGENRLFYGVPGVGKSHTIKSYVEGTKGNIERVVFHPDYTYSDFIGQIMPTIDENKNIQYEFVAGPFTVSLKAADEHPEYMHYLIIEEINRGNASAIFGEVFQLLDRDDTGQSEYGITNFDISKELYNGDRSKKIFIPSNLTILATMNTSDQNVFTLDTAFQRRWKMQLVENVIDKKKYQTDYIIVGTAVTWGAFAESINELVVEVNYNSLRSEDKRLGAYFIKHAELGKKDFPEKVLKYLWEDAFKLNKERVFRREIQAADTMIKIYEAAIDDGLEAVLEPELYAKMVKTTQDRMNRIQQ